MKADLLKNVASGFGRWRIVWVEGVLLPGTGVAPFHGGAPSPLGAFGSWRTAPGAGEVLLSGLFSIRGA